jgi:hypothetical protein
VTTWVENVRKCVSVKLFYFLKKPIGHYMYNNVEKIVENVENVRGNVCI